MLERRIGKLAVSEMASRYTETAGSSPVTIIFKLYCNMKDYLNNKLNEGDKVVCAVPHGRNSGASLSLGTVLRFTPTMVVVECSDYTYRDFEARRFLPSKVVKVP